MNGGRPLFMLQGPGGSVPPGLFPFLSLPAASAPVVDAHVLAPVPRLM